MNPSSGYRLKVASVKELSTFVDDFRTASLKVLGRKYGSMVAFRAVHILDQYCLGLGPIPADVFKKASADVRANLGINEQGLIAPALNCVIRFSFVHDAALASFEIGHNDYLKAWESMRSVVKWGWSEGEKPSQVTEPQWKTRAKYWEAMQSRGLLGGGLNFTLIEGALPDIGWGGIRRYLPTMEQRRRFAIEALKKSDASKMTERQSLEVLSARVEGHLIPDLSKSSFQDASEARKSTGSGRLREEVASAKRATEIKKASAAKIAADKSNNPSEEADKKASSIDHADIIIASDLRVFIAVPYVGLDTESRLFIQVGDKHVSFTQNGVQFGFVDSVKRTALDVLKSCKTVTVVEVQKIDEDRLLRAKHVAIVSDIGLRETFNVSLGNLKKTRFHLGTKEVSEWDSSQ